MSSSTPLDDDDSGESLLEKLKQKDEKIKEERAKAQDAQNEKIAERFMKLIDENSTLSTTISSIRLIGARRTRTSFLDPIFKPLLSENNDEPYTLDEALNKVSNAATKLSRFGIYKEPIYIFIDRSDPVRNPFSSPTDIDVFLKASELGRYKIHSGTSLGNLEGSAHTNVLFRNIFGGAEFLDFNASWGWKQREALSATFSTPVNSNPDINLFVEGLKTTNKKEWASHEEVLREFGTRLRWSRPLLEGGIPSRDARIGRTHEVGYAGSWRQITGLASNASPTIRAEAGDSIKSSISHTWTNDTRNNPFIPTMGRLLKTRNEVAGIGPLRGDVGFMKSEFEFHSGLPLFTSSSTPSGYSLTTAFRTGVMFPLPIGLNGSLYPSRINDRFQLGGANNVRGFYEGGIGPRDGSDRLGGDIYAAGGLSLLTPLPFVSLTSPFRFQVFLNGGRLVALPSNTSNSNKNENEVWTAKDVVSKVGGGIREVVTGGWPSMTAGVGLVYVHPMARFELNFLLPVVKRRGEGVRKGVQFGVGIDFM